MVGHNNVLDAIFISPSVVYTTNTITLMPLQLIY